MPVHSHDVLADSFHVRGPVFEQVELVLFRGMPSPSEDMAGTPPDEVGGLAEWIEHEELSSLGVGGEHASAKAIPFLLAPPAMEEDEARAIRGVKQVVEPVLGAGGVVVRIRDPRGCGKGQQK